MAFSSIELLENRIAPAGVPVLSLMPIAADKGAGFPLPNGSYTGAATVGAIGDLNGDGHGDFAISDTISSGNSGTIYVVFGTATGVPAGIDLTTLNGTNGFTYTDDGGETSIPYTFATGDFNHDGIDDLAIGAPFAAHVGEVHVIFGKNTLANNFFPAHFTPANVTGTAGSVIRDPRLSSGAQFGTGLAAGDLDGDGIDELIIGAPFADVPVFGGPNNNYGLTYVIKGSGMFSSVIDAGAGNSASVSVITGAMAGANSGGSLSLGDVNGDGLKDLLVGGAGAGSNFTNKGSAYVLFGKIGAWPAGLNAADLDGITGFRIPGTVSLSGRGTTVDLHGDLNGDGIDDIVLGAPTQQVGDPFPQSHTDDGTVTVVFGKKSGWTADFDPGTPDGVSGFVVTGGKFARLGRSLATGDFNGDGFDDLAMGAPDNAGGGQVVILYGHNGAFAAKYDAAALPAGSGVIVGGLPGGSRTGASVSLGDLNGDHRADLIVGSPGYSPNGNTTFGFGPGIANVIYGTPNPGGPAGPDPIFTPHKVTFTDIDGDLVTVTVTKGTLTAANFTFQEAGAGKKLVMLNLENPLIGGVSQFEGSNVKISASKSAFGGNGQVDIGTIAARGTNLGTVTIGGDLGQIEAGQDLSAASAKAGIKALTIGSFGKQLDPLSSTPVSSVIYGDLGKLTVSGSFSTAALRVSADTTGSGKIGAVVIKGGMHGGAAAGSGALVAEGAIGSINIAGGITSGFGVGSAAIRTGASIGKLNVQGDIHGYVTAPVIISAAGSNSSAGKTDVAIGAISVSGKVESALIVAGIQINGVASNSDASIGSLLVKQTWTHASLAAGVAPGFKGYGANDDALIAEAAQNPAQIARIAKIIINGGLTGNVSFQESFGFVAQEIGAVKIKGVTVLLKKGAGNDLPLQLIGGGLTLHEVA
ncbi:MAG: repeat protein [Chthoniobacteraceae bacterium]|nr:repeat protein [Chthoniobacteraceae bacterium]